MAADRSKTPVPNGEFGLIRWIRDRTATHAGTILGIGDDCAILRPSPSTDLLVTTDMLMDGRHFRLAVHGAEAVGYKAMAVNLSDIAAMAGRPVAAVVAVALPRNEAVAVAELLHRGLTVAANLHDVALVGGDTNAWDGPLVVSVTMLGEAVGRGPVRRSGARVGDVVLVTGPLGGSLLGRHLLPSARVKEAIALNEIVNIHAMIDISDGLASDLRHVLDESGGLGAVLDEHAIPIHDDARLMSRRDGRTPLDHALADGEDFELCLTVAPEDAERVIRQAESIVRLYRVGTISSEAGIRLRDAGGNTCPVQPVGFDHLGG
jgi:thiamine-monophosphate kinase